MSSYWFILRHSNNCHLSEVVINVVVINGDVTDLERYLIAAYFDDDDQKIGQ